MISAPKGVLRLAALKLLSESSLSGADLTERVARASGGEWRPGPGSVYLVLKDLRKRGLITELARREGNERRYIISAKGRSELQRMVQEAEKDVARQLRLLAVYSSMAGNAALGERVRSLARDHAAAERDRIQFPD